MTVSKLDAHPSCDGVPAAGEGLDGVDDLSYQAFRAFMTTMRLHHRLTFATLAARGTHPGQATCLRILARHDDISQRELADALFIAPPTVTRMLQAMEKAGLVVRRADETDQRLTRVYLTAAGRALERELREAMAAFVNETIGTLPEGDRRELARLLGALGARFSAALDATREARTDRAASDDAGVAS